MKKALCTLLTLLAFDSISFAQSESQAASPKKFRHHVGVQINELVRQVFNFSNNNATNNNPYLLVYSINSAKTGWGARVGVGYTYRSFTEDDGSNKKESDINTMQFRLGAEKAFALSGKWSAGIGIDGLYNRDDNYTASTTKAFDTSLTITKTDVSSFGGGAMGWLRYHLTDKVIIGTETSFYYVTGNQKMDISITTKSFGNPITSSTSKVDNKVSEGVFRMPVAIYLMIRF